MALQNSFDLAKKQAEGANLSSGYTMEDGRFYNAYLTNEEWDSFRSEMEKDYPIAFKNYKDGYRYGRPPPESQVGDAPGRSPHCRPPAADS